MQSQPLVSVVIPCYNVSVYVEKAVSSIIQQTYKHLEILIVDDASTDDTLTVIKRLHDNRITVIELVENTQKIGAVNKALQVAKGDLIAFQDADDWAQPTRIQEQVNQFMAQPQLGICFTNYTVVGKKSFVPKRIALTDEELKDEFLQFLHKKNTTFAATNCPTMMITKQVLQATVGYHPYFAGRVAEDIHWIYRILKNFQGVTINKPLYNYTVREGAFTQQQLSGKKAKYIYSWHLLSKIIFKDIHENIDVLLPEHAAELQRLELLACEEALAEKTVGLHNLQIAFETRASYRLGKMLLFPFHLLKSRLLPLL